MTSLYCDVLQVQALNAANEPPYELQDMLLVAFKLMPAQTALSSNVAVQLAQAIASQQAAKDCWKDWVSEQFTPELAGSLFLAAAARDNAAGVKVLHALKPAALTGAVAGQVLAAAVQQHKTKVLTALCGLCTAKAWDAGALVPPLVMAVRLGNAAGVQQIFSIEGLKQRLDAAQVAAVMLVMLKAGCSTQHYVQQLTKLPVAQQLEWGRCEALFDAAVSQHSTQLPTLIKGMPAQAAQMKARHVLAAAQMAADLRDEATLQQLLQHTAARVLQPAQLSQLLQPVLPLRGSMHAVRGPLQALCSMQAVQQLSHKMIEDVLQAAFMVRVWPVLLWLVPLMCQLPQAHLMQLGGVRRWLQLALDRPAQHTAAALFSWLESNAVQPSLTSTVSGLNSSDAEDLLASALPTATGGSMPGLKALCSLQCVRRATDAGTVVHMLDRTFTFNRVNACTGPGTATKLLLQLPAAAHVSATELARLLECVLQHCSDDLLADDLLQQLLERGNLPGQDELLSLITICLQERADVSAAACIQLLCWDPAARQISGSMVLQLLLDALKLQQPHAVLALVQGLPAAAELTIKLAEQLLHATITAALQQQHHAAAASANQAASESAAAQQAAAACWSAAVQAVVSVPAVLQVKTDMALQLMGKAIKHGAATIIQHLASIRSLQQLHSSSVGSLLRLAVQLQQPDCLQVLLQLPGAAASCSSDQVLQMLQASVERDAHRVVGVLCCTQSAQQLQPEQVSRLLAAAVDKGKSLESVVLLCKLPAAPRLSLVRLRGLTEAVQDAVQGLQAAVKKQREAEFNSLVRNMKMRKKAAGRESSEQQAMQPGKELGVRALNALQALHSAGRIHNS